MNGGGGSSGITNDGKNGKSASAANAKYGKASSLFGAGGLGGRGDDDKIKKMTDQTIQENIRTTEKVNQLRLKLELVNARKKLKSIKFPIKSGGKKLSTDDKQQNVVSGDDSEKSHTAPPMKTKESEKIKLRNQAERNLLSAESKMKIKENLSRNRSFKTILTQPSSISNSTSSMSLFNNEINPLEFCFSATPNEVASGGGSKLGRSLSFQSNYIFNRTDASSLATMEATTISNSTPIIQEYVEAICEPSTSSTATATTLKEITPKSGYSTSMQDLLLQEFLSKSTKTSSSHFQLTPAAAASNRDFTSATKNSAGSALKISAEADKTDMFKFKGSTIAKVILQMDSNKNHQCI